MFEDDMCMCKAKACPLKEKCKRYTDEELKLLQACFAEMQYKNGKCEYFMDKIKLCRKI